MRPLRGVVTRAGRALVIRLESGKLVETTNDYKLSKYDVVDVRYDFTENRVVAVEPVNPNAEILEDPATEGPDEPENESVDAEDEATIEPGHSGALYTAGDSGLNEWDPETGVITLENY